MKTVQLVLSDPSYARRLKHLLGDNGKWSVSIKDDPDFQRAGIIVFDQNTLANLSAPPAYPERVVLVTGNDEEILSHAWDLGIRSVVYTTQPPETILLAVMAAYLRLPGSSQSTEERVISRNRSQPLLSIDPKNRSDGSK